MSGYEFTFGKTPACVKLAQVFQERPQLKISKLRKATRLFQRFHNTVNSIHDMAASKKIKIYFLKLHYENCAAYIETTFFDEDDLIVSQLMKNVLIMYYAKARRTIIEGLIVMNEFDPKTWVFRDKFSKNDFYYYCPMSDKDFFGPFGNKETATRLSLEDNNIFLGEKNNE